MIEVYDNFFSQEIQHQIYTFLMNTGGWTLTGGDPTKNRFWHFENLEQINYFNDFLYKKIIDKLNKKIDSFERIYANGQTSGQCGTLHIDDGDSTFLYYPNPEWKTDYQGHLIFFNGAKDGHLPGGRKLISVGSTGPASPRWKARAQPVTAEQVL